MLLTARSTIVLAIAPCSRRRFWRRRQTAGPDGNLYVAEGGADGTTSTTAGQCTQVKPPIGPYKGGSSADILRYSSGGTRSTVVGGLPSDQSAPPRNFQSGVADVAFIGHTMYALETGAGCSHGNATVVNAVLRVNRDRAVVPERDDDRA